MSQEYTPVTWVDETPNTPGTVINKARLDQMQTAHHFADGFEEVDAVPTTDPGVDYHKVVYCTADTTFYRWNGSAWTKDVDDETKALLLAHEADHDNPHVVTKAQVGLGNVDNTSDADKPVSDATQAALDDKVDDAQIKSSWSSPVSDDNIASEKLVKDTLDGKVTIIPVTSGVKFYSQSSGGTSLYQGTSSPVTGITSVPLRDSSGRIKTAAPSANDDAANKKYVDDADALKINTSAMVSAWQGTPDDDHIPTEKLVKTYVDTSLTDGSVTKIGTANVGTDTKPIKLVAGVPTAVANDLVDIPSNQTITGTKTYTNVVTFSTSGDTSRIIMKRTNLWEDANVTGSRRGSIIGFSDQGDNIILKMTPWKTTADTHLSVYASRDGHTDVWAGEFGVTTGGAGYMKAATRTYLASNTSDVVTIGSLQSSTDVVHTSGNETISGQKTFSTIEAGAGISMKTDNLDTSMTYTANREGQAIKFFDKNDVFLGKLSVVQLANSSAIRLNLWLRNNDGTNKIITLGSGDL